MHPLIKKSVRTGKLGYLWVTRILFAPDHFGVPLHVRLRLAMTRGFIPDQYVIYDLKHNDPGEYLSEFDWYRSRYINEPFNTMLNNKVVCTEMLSPFVSVPEILLVKSRGRMAVQADGARYCSIDEAIAVIVEAGAVFKKPIGDGKGHGVHRIDATSEGFLIDAAPVTEGEVRQFLDADDEWFLCALVEQSEELAAIYSETSNTIRLITLRDPETGAVEVFFAVLRIGTAATVPVDNGSRGGLVAQIDLETGIVSEARSLWSTAVHEVHPDSGAAIKGFQIPRWSEVKRELLSTSQKFPYLHFIAWDILLTKGGLTVIEANTSSGVNIIQLWGAQRHGKLGSFYRAHGVRS